MATERDIKDVLYDWLNTATGIAVRWSDQPEKDQSLGAPQPNAVYAEMKFISGPKREGLSDDEIPPDGDSPSEEFTIAGQRLLTLNVQILGSGSYDYMVAAQDSLQDQEVRDSLKRRQTAKITVNSPVTPGLDYIITIKGVVIQKTSIGGDDQEAIRDKLIIEVNDSAYVNVTASVGATTDELILTGNVGKEFSLLVNANLTLGDQVTAVDLAVIGDEGIIDVAELLETVWEPRKSMDVFLRSHTAVFKSPEYIESAEITGDVSGNAITIDVVT